MSRNDASLLDGNVASWVEMLSTNVLGTAMTTKAVVQDMRRRGQWGHIINMVGLSGHRIPDGPQGGGFYCATKSAVKTITEGLRQEVGACTALCAFFGLTCRGCIGGVGASEKCVRADVSLIRARPRACTHTHTHCLPSPLHTHGHTYSHTHTPTHTCTHTRTCTLL